MQVLNSIISFLICLLVFGGLVWLLPPIGLYHGFGSQFPVEPWRTYSTWPRESFKKFVSCFKLPMYGMSLGIACHAAKVPGPDEWPFWVVLFMSVGAVWGIVRYSKL